jgi:TetR/AcrR family transcriptional regulator
VDLPAARAARTQRKTRIQRRNENRILDAALDVFAAGGFRGATIDGIAEAAGMSKPNLLYYFPTKEAIHRQLIERLLETWLDPLRAIDADGDPLSEISAYIRRKIEMARDYPRESRLFANEIIQGAPHVEDVLAGGLRQLVDEKAAVVRVWIEQGRLNACDPYHLIFAIWATTQHYADFDAQVRAVLGPERAGPRRFDDAAGFLDQLFIEGLRPMRNAGPRATVTPD